MTVTESFVPTRRGRIHVARHGRGEPLLLLHSNGCSLHEYADTMRPLGARFDCIAWDMPGHGDSDPAPGHLSVEDYADAAIGLLDALGIARAHACGASIGGLVCIALGARHPRRLSSTVIVEAPLRTEAQWAAQWPRVEAMFAIAQQSEAEVAPRVRALAPETLVRWNIDRLKAGSWRMVDVMWACRQYDALGDLPRVGCPAAVLIGERGPVAGQADAYRRLLPHAPVRMLHDAGHFPMLDDPDAFAAAVVESIAEAVGGGSPR